MRGAGAALLLTGFFHAPDRRHVGIFGPSGCGKTSTLIIPTLLQERSSMVVLDIKRELHHLTAVHRRDQLGNTIHSFAPSLDEEWVAGWNPILDIPKGPLEVAQAQALGWWRTISQTSALGRLSGPWGL